MIFCEMTEVGGRETGVGGGEVEKLKGLKGLKGGRNLEFGS